MFLVVAHFPALHIHDFLQQCSFIVILFSGIAIWRQYLLLSLNYMFTVFLPNWNTDTVYDIGLVCFPGPLCPIVVYFCQSTLTLTTLCCQDIHWRHTTCMRWMGYSSLQYDKIWSMSFWRLSKHCSASKDEIKDVVYFMVKAVWLD